MKNLNEVKSIYIHIPFCKEICSYCDFCKFYYNNNLVDDYLKELAFEIKERYKKETVDTIYIGGGTPSSLSIPQLETLFSIIDDIITSSNLEFTIECNIQDITEEQLKLFKKCGVNRLSIGVQSFDENILNFLERNYSKQFIINQISLAKQYFSNINIDLIYAVPNETLEILKKDLDFFLSLEVPHISTYSLMIEEHTKLGIQNINPIIDELDQKMYDIIQKELVNSGYIHYEISNYALPGYESKHNLTYWKNERYYGFGLGASGYIKNIRYTNTKNIKKYLSHNYVQEEENISSHIDASNYAILGLRTINGVNKKVFLEKFKVDFIEYFDVHSLLLDHILLENDISYYLNPKYWYLSNEILVKFI